MLTRRAFLKSSGLALLAVGLGGTPLFLRRAVAATAQSGSHKVLVTIFQRGAMDGIMAVSPFADENLRCWRPRLALPAPGASAEALLDLDGRFGLHPAFEPILPLFKEKTLAIVHGVGSPDPTRSHFDQQDYMETGTPGRKGTPDGWLNRLAKELGNEASPFRAVSITKALPRSLYGKVPALAIENLADFGVKMPGASEIAMAAGQGFEALYEQTSQQLLRSAGQESFEALKILQKLDVKNYRPQQGAEYPRSPLGHSLKQIAQLIKADVGVEIAFAESGGWDTHAQQGTTRGLFARRAHELAQAIAAFWKDLERKQDRIVLMTMTEFGRTLAENGSGGTDHGRASCLFVLGHPVDGGKVHGTVPELARENLEDGRDLPVTTDFRAVFSEVAGKHFGLKDATKLFPGWNGTRLALLKAERH
ncbi:MAG: hypothetical protein CMR00_12265 [[Chlorobium] sp. 445]|nr:MAG: hypothetical protein CMR00_12265 [[Chlorobium] sp. 445]